LILVVLAIVAAIVGGNSGRTPGSSPTSSAAPAPPPLSRKEEALRHVEITKWSWKKGGFDSVMLATFTFKNNNTFAVKDITVRCTHSAESGTVIDNNTRTIYERIDAGKKHTVHDFSMGFIHTQASSSNCAITNVVPAE